MPLPNRAGVGLKAQHVPAVLETEPDLGFFEIHAENYMGDGGAPHAQLRAIRERYDLSLHGVALSIGGADPLDKDHLARLKSLIERYKPASFSEHLAWSSHDEAYYNDLLPVPYNGKTLDRVCDHIDEVQATLGVRMLLENPSTYVAFDTSTMNEIDFLKEIVRRTGCGLLLDVNNVHVSATNHGYDADAYLRQFPLAAVGEIHLGGHAEDQDDHGARLLIDAHDREIADPVWMLYETLLSLTGPVATLVEWDNDVPDWPVLFAEAVAAEGLLRKAEARASELVGDGSGTVPAGLAGDGGGQRKKEMHYGSRAFAG
ncbi:MAG: DUF692 domain-containing protein [Pseudomonadota bacterium]